MSETLQGSVTPTTPEKRGFTPLESAAAWVCLLLGYLFCRVVPVIRHPLGGFLFILVLYVGTLLMLWKQGQRPGLLPLLAAASAVVISSSLLFCAVPMIHTVAYLYALGALMYLLYAAGGNTLEQGFSDLLPADFLKALLLMPFSAFGELFRAIATGKFKSVGKVLLRVALGIAVAFIPTLIVWLLLSYDAAFNSLLGDIFSFDFSEIFSHIGSLLLGVPVGMYLFGALIASADRRCNGTLTAESCRRVSAKVRVVPAVTAVCAVLPILSLYVIFFISQWQYYISGFLGVLPQEFNYAEYAREGFFQLCAVSVINLLILAAVSLLMRRREGRSPVLLRALSLVFAVFTLVLIATAIAKMVMYIDCYGLTPKRVYATWFMLMLAAVFVLVIVRQFAQKLKLIALSVAVCVAMFAGLALAGVDGIIASYNVDRYLAGTLDSVDLEAMEELGDAAIPELVRLTQHMDRQHGTDIATFTEDDLQNDDDYSAVAAALYLMAADREQATLFGFTLPQARATAALREVGIGSELTERRTQIYTHYVMGYSVEDSFSAAEYDEGPYDDVYY